MKILKTLCLLAFAAVMPAMLTSCDDDDDEPSSSASSSSSSYSGPAFGLRDCGKVISSIDMYYGPLISFVYDGSGRVVKSYQDFGWQETVSYDYNSQTGEVVTENNDGVAKISFEADANGKFNSLIHKSRDGHIKRVYEFKYNSDGNVIQGEGRRYKMGMQEWINEEYNTYTFIWDGDLLTSVRCTESDYDITDEYEMKIIYSDVDNTYRTPLCGLTTMLFGEDFYPNELSIAPAKLPMKIVYYQSGDLDDEVMCKYNVDDDGFIESEHIEGYGNRYDVYYTYTYADKEF